MKFTTPFITLFMAVAVLFQACDSHDANPVEQGEDEQEQNQEEEKGLTTKVMDYKPLNKISLDESEKVYVHGLNDFAFSITKEVESSKTGVSTIISPWSLSTVLAMTLNGADGETRSQIAGLLGFGDASDEEVNSFAQKILDGAACIDTDVEVICANGLLKQQGTELNQDFSNDLKSYYDAEIWNKDDDAVTEINDWLRERTGGKISDMISEGDISNSAILYLINALYFNGTWREPFDSTKTEQHCFTKSNGDESGVETMRGEKTCLYAENDDFSAMQLPYGNEGWNMVVLLPAEGKTVADMLGSLDAETWEKLLNSLGNCSVDIYLPKFSTTSKVHFRNTLYGMGLTDMFTLEADFSRLCDDPLCVSEILQVSTIAVDEEGTEAKTVTIEEFEATSAGPMDVPVKEFAALRPFVYIITDSTTGTIWFTGVFNGD